MIVITGGFTATPETVDMLRAAALAHGARSRTEDGCIGHHVHIDVEDPLRFVFFERWRDTASVTAHFGVPASGGFVALLRAHAVAIEAPTLYEATAVTI